MLLNFSDGANAHRSVRFSSRAVRVSSALLLNAYGPPLYGTFFFIWFPTKLSAGPYESFDKKQFFLSSGMYSISVSANETILL